MDSGVVVSGAKETGLVRKLRSDLEIQTDRDRYSFRRRQRGRERHTYTHTGRLTERQTGRQAEKQ